MRLGKLFDILGETSAKLVTCRLCSGLGNSPDSGHPVHVGPRQAPASPEFRRCLYKRHNMNERWRRILIIAGFIATVAAIGIGMFFLFFRTDKEPAPGAPTTEVPTGLEPGALRPSGEAPIRTEEPTRARELKPADRVARGGKTQTTTLTEEPAVNLAIAANGKNLNYYNKDDGKFYTIDPEGNVKELSNKKFPSVQSVAWNKEADKAILQFPDGSNVIYNFLTSSQITLPKHWDDFQFSPVKEEFTAKSLGIDPDNRWLLTANADGSGARAIQELGRNANKVTVSWSPNDQVVAFSDTADYVGGGIDRKMILPIGKNKENFRGLVVEGFSFLPAWSPSGKQLVYSTHGDYSTLKPLLWTVDATPSTMGQNRRSLGLNTWADKCAFASGKTMYCAVPVNLPANSGFQRVLFENYPDQLYKVDMTSGAVSLVAVPEDDTTMENLHVGGDESLLYYTNKRTGALESINLK